MMHTPRRWLAGAALLLCSSVAGAAKTPLPPALQSFTEQGLEVVGELPAPQGMTGWAIRIGTRSASVYVTADGKNAIAGTWFDAEGNDKSSEALQSAAAEPLSKAVWDTLEKTSWIADGKAEAPRIVYVFTDPNCPYCAQLWQQARPWVAAGKVQLRHLMVGIISPTSRGKAAALLSASDPAKTLNDYETWHASAKGKTGGPISEMKDIPPAIAAKIDANEALMREWNLQATPTVIWRDESGKLHQRTGVAPGMLEQVLGPRP